MIANVGPADWNFDETLSTLRYANRAKNIKNKPKINEDPKDTMLREYQEEIARLKSALEGRPAPAASFSLSEEEMVNMRSEIEEQLKMSLTATGTVKLSAEQLSQVQSACGFAGEQLTCVQKSGETLGFGLADSKRRHQPAFACRLRRRQGLKQKSARKSLRSRQRLLPKKLHASKQRHTHNWVWCLSSTE